MTSGQEKQEIAEWLNKRIRNIHDRITSMEVGSDILISLGEYRNKQEVDTKIEALEKIVRNLQRVLTNSDELAKLPRLLALIDAPTLVEARPVYTPQSGRSTQKTPMIDSNDPAVDEDTPLGVLEAVGEYERILVMQGEVDPEDAIDAH